MAAFLCGASAALGQPAPSLGSADSFVILAGTGVVNSGPTRVTGSIGVSSAAGIRGLPDEMPRPGGRFINDPFARRAQQANASVYNDLAGRPCREGDSLTAFPEFPETLLPNRVYCFPSDARLTGRLRFAGTRNDVWIIQIGGNLEVDDNASILLQDDALSSHIFWTVGNSATLGAGSAFAGNILARGDITFGRGVTFAGRALSQLGTVTLDADAINLCGKLVVLSPLTLPPGTVDVNYSAPAITASGGDAPYTLEIIDGSLPPGLSLDLAGKPQVPGRFVFGVLATDANGALGVRFYEIDVCPQIVLPPPLPPGHVCDAYRVCLGNLSYDIKGLPPDLSPLGNCIVGIPRVKGDFPIEIKVTDPLSGCTASTKSTLTIDCNVMIAANLPDGKACQPYRGTLRASCQGNASVQLVSGVLPCGPLLSNGDIICTPTTPGSYTFTARIDHESGCSTTGTYTIVVAEADPLPPIVINGTVCVPIDVSAVAGTISPPLPPNQIFRKTGPSTFTTIDPTRCPREQSLVIIIACPTKILAPNLPDKLPFYKLITPIDVARPELLGCFTYSINLATLPHNLGLDPSSTHIIIGQPDTLEKTEIEVTATDPESGCTVTEIYPLEIVDPPLCEAAIVISPAPRRLAFGTVGVPYPPLKFTASGGAAPYAYDVPAPALPPGLTLSIGGILSGTPTKAGRFNFAVRATDATGAPGCPQVYSIGIGN